MKQQTVKSVNKFYENTPQQKAQSTLSVINGFLIPDLTNLVLKYCWPKEKIADYNFNTKMIFMYGDYESVLTLFKYIATSHVRSFRIMYWSGYGGYIKCINLVINHHIEKIWRNDWCAACRGAYNGGHEDIMNILIKRCNGDVFGQ